MDFHDNQEDEPTSLAIGPSPRPENEKEPQSPEGETSTCRICRGEETSDEPLFYPCKCSGSIRYVHQACLMEWLSRSGKRHCELCKTPFRFTKLYDPSMPASVPIPVFARQACVQMLAATLRVLRWALVLFVWLAWVPWAMRLMWRFLFWLADGAWIEHPFHYDVGLPGSLGTLSITAYSRKGLQNSTVGDQIAQVANAVTNSTSKPNILRLFSDHVSSILWENAGTENVTSSQPLMLRLGIRLFRGIFPLAGRSASDIDANMTSSLGPQLQLRTTLLSDVVYLKNFTKWPYVNRVIMDILEGQMITIFVMVFLVLVFLIREWVVQQQPGVGAPRAADRQPAIEDRPAAGNDENNGDEVGQQQQQQQQQAGQEEETGPTLPQFELSNVVGTSSRPFVPYRESEPSSEGFNYYQSITFLETYRDNSFEELRLVDYQNDQLGPWKDLSSHPRTLGDLARVHSQGTPLERQASLHGNMSSPQIARPYESISLEAQRPPPDASPELRYDLPSNLLGQSVSDDAWSTTAMEHDSQEHENNSESLQNQRPQMPSRNALDKASRLHRVLEEERNKVGGDRWPGITTFMDFWNRGNCDPQIVLQLIHDENREGELAWIVKAMRRLQKAEDSDSDVLTHQTPAAQPNHPAADDHELSNSSHGSWQVVEDVHAQESSITQAANSTQDGGDTDQDAAPALANRSHSAPIPRMEISEQSRITSSRDHGEEADAADPADHAVPWPTELDPTGTSQPEPRQDVRGEPLLLPEGPESTDEVPAPDGVAEIPIVSENSSASEDVAPVLPQSTWQSLGDMMWGNVELLPAEQERVAGQLQPVLQPEIEHEPVQAPQPHAAHDAEARANEGGAGPMPAPAPGPDPEVLRAAREAGIDPEDAQAIDDGEELDGLVELIGLEGPLIALLQHAVVCAAIVSLVVFLGVWIPYILGKVMLVIISNPITLLVKMPLRCVLFVFEVVLDTAIVLLTGAYYYVDSICRSLVSPVGWMVPIIGRIQGNTAISDKALSLSHDSLQRLVQGFSFGGEGLADSDIPYFSIVAHESLSSIKGFAYGIVAALYRWLRETLQTTDLVYKCFVAAWSFLPNIPWWAFGQIKWELGIAANITKGLFSFLVTNPLKLRLDFPERSVPLDLSLIHWSAWDRFFAILLGYLALYVVGSIYTRVVEALRNPEDQQDEAVEIIYQACGVLKVILIISIEMIAFPLYCGILLDIAMLPLFRDATILSRLAFTARSPWTSLFLHWFVGTCYMFHFALFVSMCRKEMRSGVLYFIRDPDDETFHPVRDVLERNLGGQLRKIAFSAFVYGLLVTVCLGTVVWGVGSLPVSVFPVTWSTDHPLDELPIDLCVYNFLIPIAIRALDPSQVLTDMYKWWFRRCAKFLRLSHFLFGERRLVEEGLWEEAETSGGFQISSEEDNDASSDLPEEGETDAMELDFSPHTVPQEGFNRNEEPKVRRFMRDGRFVRAPATDRVRIPRGHRAFLQVDEFNNRTDGEPEATEGLHAKSSTQFQLVYLPPHFQVRIGLFAVLLWAFAAVTGLLTTVLPLSIGRAALALLTPEGVPTNDIHAYVFGSYTLGTPLLLALRHKKRLNAALKGSKVWMGRGGIDMSRITSVVIKIAKISLRVLRVLYFYSFAGFVLPTIFSAVFWFYVAIPAYTFTGSKVSFEDHTTHISLIQNWVLGVLFMRVVGRIVHSHQESRITRALYAIVRNNNGAGWSDPDVKLATRALILPSLLAATVALLAPLSLGFVANAFYFQSKSPELPTLVYRYSYPVVAGMITMFFFVRFLRSAYSKWRSRIRDEVYLVGERLHNFGERRPVVTDRIASSA